MSAEPISHDDDAHPPGEDLPVYVLVGRSNHSGEIPIATDQSRYGPAPRCFLSPVDALLEMAFVQRHQKDIVNAVWPANRAPARAFLFSEFRQRPLAIHTAWLAHDDRLIVSSNGYLGRLVLDQPEKWRARYQDPACMVIDHDTLDMLDRVHERAGLFAWQETLESIRDEFAKPFLQQTGLRRAIASFDDIRTIRVSMDDATQLALYDPEAARWHFVPRNAGDTRQLSRS